MTELRTADEDHATGKRSEATIADTIARAWQVELVSFPDYCRVDYYAHRAGRIFGIVEIKTRTHPATDSTLFLLSAAKYLSVRDIAHGFHVPPLLVVGWTDRIGWIDLDRAPIHHVAVSGRRDRDPRVQPKDTELCVFIRVARFATIDA